MPSDALRLVAALRDAHDRLYAFATGLGAGDLQQISYCDEWTIAQVLSHLGSAADIGRATLLAALGEGEPLDDKGREAIWDRWNAKSAEEQAADSGASDDAMLALLEELPPERLEAMRAPFAGREISSAELLRLFLAERVLHSWDIEVVFEPSVRLRPDHVELLLGALGMLVPWYADSSAFDGPGAVSIDTVEPERHFLLEKGEAVSLRESEPMPGGAQAKLPAEAFIRLVYGRLDEDHTPTGIETSGITLDQLRRLFPGR